MNLAIINVGAGLTATAPILGPISPRDRDDLLFRMVIADVAPELWKETRLGALAKSRQARRQADREAIRRAERLIAPIAEIRPNREVEDARATVLAAIAERDRIRAAIPVDKSALHRAMLAVREAQAAHDQAVQDQAETRRRGIDEAEARDQAQARGDEIVQIETEVTTWATDEDGNRIVDKKGRPSLVVTFAQALVAPDGLDLLLAAGTIDKNEHAAGDWYQGLYIKADHERALTPPEPGRIVNTSAGGGDPFGEAACERIFKRLDASKRVLQLEASVMESVIAHFPESEVLARQRASETVEILRAVAGKGKSIRQAVSGGRKRERMTRLLKLALGVLADEAGLW